MSLPPPSPAPPGVFAVVVSAFGGADAGMFLEVVTCIYTFEKCMFGDQVGRGGRERKHLV